MLRNIVSRALSSRASGMRGTSASGGGLGGTRTGMGTGAAGGGRTQDEAIGRGVRSLMRRFRA